MRRPIWVRPDWSFVEEGEPIPSARAQERYEPGVLGEYGLYFGDGYLIHGTLFERFLGQSVTHGCIRVGDKPLEEIWKRTRVGTRIYIY
jgi:L,D-transpeptidase YbiS